jgi:cytochrome c-type biogenesis protein CcmH
MIWLVFALLTGAAVMAVLAPLAFRGASQDETAGDVAFFEAQLAEIARESAEGRLAADEAEAAKTEAARRLLRARDKQSGAAQPSRRRALIAAIGAIALMPAVALTLYWRFGHADMPDFPLQARLDARPEQPDLAGAVARIESHLREHPNDGRGFEVVAPYYLRAGRAEDALHAYSEALRLLGATPQRYATLGEARVIAEKGEVTPAARADFEAATRLDPKLPIARYYLGLAAAQNQDVAAATEIWSKLLAEAPPGAPWADVVRRALGALAGGPVTAPQASAQGQAIAALPEGERQGAIRAMVERLAARLKDQGGGTEDWLKLMRAFSVLGEAEKARETLLSARKALAADGEAVKRLDAAARELNITAN